MGFWSVDEISEVVRICLASEFGIWNDTTLGRSELSSDACPDSWVWSDEKPSSKSMVVFSSEYGASLDFSGGERSSKVTSSTVVAEHLRQYV